MKTRHEEKAATGSVRASNEQMRDEIIDWLRDAYAMERGLESSLKKQSENDELDPEVRQRAASHLEETRRHAEEVKAALQALGTDTSALKTGMGMTAQATKGLATMFARDQQIKDMLDAYSMEHFEIACYMALAAAAEQAGLTQVVDLCRRIIPDEERMAHALRGSLPTEVSGYLAGTARPRRA